MTVAEFAAALRAELDRAGLSLRQLAEKVAQLRSRSGAVAMSSSTLGELTSRTRARLPDAAQLRTILAACGTTRPRAQFLLANWAALDQQRRQPPEAMATSAAVQAVAPLLVGVLPEPPANFQDRIEAAQLFAAARLGTPAALIQRTSIDGTDGAGRHIVVSGLGGVGKTQLAAHLARHMRATRAVDVLVWVRATTRTDILTAYADAATVLAASARGRGQAGGALLGVRGDSDASGERAARLFLSWLNTTEQRWAVVLDNLNTPADIQGLWPPLTPNGRTVITTRRRDASLLTGRLIVDVEVFTPDAAIAFLTARLPPALAADTSAVVGVAEDLGRLPLALSHAAAYMIDQNLPCHRYRDRFADQHRRLAELFPDAHSLFDDSTAAVASTWTLSVEAADALGPHGLAGRVLALSSLLDSTAIPLIVLTAPAALAYLAAPDADTVLAAVTSLRRFSLITRSDAIIAIHALVARAARDHLDLAVDRAAQAAADALLQAWPDHEHDDPALVVHLRANTTALHEIRGDALLKPDDAGHYLLLRLVRSLGSAGLTSAALVTAGAVHRAAKRVLGADHPNTLTTRRELARWRGEAGEFAGAATVLEQLLPDMVRVLGPDHPDTLTTLRELARWRGEAGDNLGAVDALEQLLPDMVRVLGPDHPDTLTTLRELHAWRGQTGDHAGAADALEQLLPDMVRALGPDHPDTLTARRELARWRGEAGD